MPAVGRMNCLYRQFLSKAFGSVAGIFPILEPSTFDFTRICLSEH